MVQPTRNRNSMPCLQCWNGMRTHMSEYTPSHAWTLDLSLAHTAGFSDVCGLHGHLTIQQKDGCNFNLMMYSRYMIMSLRWCCNVPSYTYTFPVS
eukprot:4233124-Amphidinium_carterae.2